MRARPTPLRSPRRANSFFVLAFQILVVLVSVMLGVHLYYQICSSGTGCVTVLEASRSSLKRDAPAASEPDLVQPLRPAAVTLSPPPANSDPVANVERRLPSAPSANAAIADRHKQGTDTRANSTEAANAAAQDALLGALEAERRSHLQQPSSASQRSFGSVNVFDVDEKEERSGARQRQAPRASANGSAAIDTARASSAHLAAPDARPLESQARSHVEPQTLEPVGSINHDSPKIAEGVPEPAPQGVADDVAITAPVGSASNAAQPSSSTTDTGPTATAAGQELRAEPGPLTANASAAVISSHVAEAEAVVQELARPAAEASKAYEKFERFHLRKGEDNGFQAGVAFDLGLGASPAAQKAAKCPIPRPDKRKHDDVPPNRIEIFDSQTCIYRVPLRYSTKLEYVGPYQRLKSLPDPICPVQYRKRKHGTEECKSRSKAIVYDDFSVSTALDIWWHTAPTDPCLDEQFTSSCQLEDVMAGDLEDGAQLARLAAARSWRREIVFTAVNAAGTRLAVNLMLSLRAQGIDHTFVLTDSAVHCKAMYYSEARISCGWTSFLYQHPGLKTFDLRWCGGPGRGCADAVHLWYARIHYMARLIDVGTNPIYMDTDFTVQTNFYRYFHTPTMPMSRHNMYMQREAYCLTCNNIGFLYCRDCAAGGPAQWVFRTTIDRLVAALALPSAQELWRPLLDAGVITKKDIRPFMSAKKAMWDQHNINDAVESAVEGADVRRRQWTLWLAPEARERYFRDFLRAEGVTARLPEWPREWKGMVWANLTWPHERATVANESMANAPPWLVGGFAGIEGEKRGWSGLFGHWQARTPPIAHFVGGPDKEKNIKAEGWWHWDAEAVAANVARAMAHFEWQPPNTTAPQGEAEARDRAAWAPYLEPLKTTRHRLYTRKFISWSGLRYKCEDVYEFANEYFRALWKLVVIGLLTDRLAVLPPFDCGSGWISKSASSRDGISQSAWRWDWRPEEEASNVVHNGVNLFNCSSNYGLPDEAPQHNCCVPWVTGNSPLNMCSRGQRGYVHHQDLEHAIRMTRRHALWTARAPPPPLAGDSRTVVRSATHAESGAASQVVELVASSLPRPAYKERSWAVPWWAADRTALLAANATGARPDGRGAGDDSPEKASDEELQAAVLQLQRELQRFNGSQVMYLHLEDLRDLPLARLWDLPPALRKEAKALVKSCGTLWAFFTRDNNQWLGWNRHAS